MTVARRLTGAHRPDLHLEPDHGRRGRHYYGPDVVTDVEQYRAPSCVRILHGYPSISPTSVHRCSPDEHLCAEVWIDGRTSGPERPGSRQSGAPGRGTCS